MLSTTAQKTFPTGLPKGFQKGLPKGLPKGFPKGFPKGLPKGGPSPTRKIAEKTTEKTAENLSKKRNARSGNSGNGTKPSILNPKTIFQQFFRSVIQGVFRDPRRRAEKPEIYYFSSIFPMIFQQVF